MIQLCRHGMDLSWETCFYCELEIKVSKLAHDNKFIIVEYELNIQQLQEQVVFLINENRKLILRVDNLDNRQLPEKYNDTCHV
jgi:hypothetical protein